MQNKSKQTNKGRSFFAVTIHGGHIQQAGADGMMQADVPQDSPETQMDGLLTAAG